MKRLAVPRSSVNPVVTTLPNGLVLIVQPESVSNTISVVGHVKTRPVLEAPPGQEGVDEVLEGLFDFGTESLDRVAYQKALDEIGADAGAGADFAVGVLAEEFERGVQLLADNELRPALPEAAFAIVQKQVADKRGGARRERGVSGAQGARRGALPAGRSDAARGVGDVGDGAHARRREGVLPTRLPPRPYDDRRDRQGDAGGGARGDREAFRGVDGRWPAAPTDLPPVPLNNPTVVRVPNDQRVQDNVTLAETLGLNRFDPDYYASSWATASSAAPSTPRASTAICARTPCSVVRQLGGRAGQDAGAFTSWRTAFDPANVVKARGIVVRELTTMQTTPGARR